MDALAPPRFASDAHASTPVAHEGEFAPLDTTVTIKPGVTTNVFANFRTGEIKVVER